MRVLRRLLITSLWTLLSLILTAVIIITAIYLYIEIQLPNVAVLKDVHMQVPLRIYTRDGRLIGQYGAKRRIPVTLDKIPKPLIQAVLATEDARYYEHPGVDLISMVRAAKAVIQSRRKVQGASTITMQVARNFFLTREKTYTRKIKEVLLALKIDRELSKDKVLELYLNKVYFGNRAYGVAAAAQVYYGKRLDQLTLAQMAMIAGLPQAPSRNNPLRRPRAALERRNHVLKRMYDLHFITTEQYQKAIRAPVTAKYHNKKVTIHAPHMAEMVRQVLFSEYGARAYEMGLRVYTTLRRDLQIHAEHALQQGLIAYSMRRGYLPAQENLGVATGDYKARWQTALAALLPAAGLQPAAVIANSGQQAVALLASGQTITLPWATLQWARLRLPTGYLGPKPENAAAVVHIGDVVWVSQQGQQWELKQYPQVQGALVAMNPQTGAILALVGGFDYQHSHFNRAIMAARQPGSNFKPFIYSAALAKGFTLASIINDAPIVIRDPGENTLWRPHNDNYRFYGPTRLRVGLTKSRNLVSIRLLQAVGVDYTLNYLQRFGFDSHALPHALSLALGSALTTPVKIASAYAIFANGGYQVKPYFIDRIINEDNQIVYQAQPQLACEACITAPPGTPVSASSPMAPRVISATNAYLITQALRGVIQKGTGRAAKVLHRQDLAGKTGTTNNQVDAWFSGFNSRILTTVWVGFDNNDKSLHEYGSQAALPIWIDFMHSALAGTSLATMPEPPGIMTARIDPQSGLLAPPNDTHAIFEVFRRDHVPQRYARINTQSTVSSAMSGPAAASHASNAEQQPLF